MDVVCAIIVRNGRVFAAKRKASKTNPNLWEFPGGKIEAGEDHYACIIREMREEFNITVIPTGRFEPSSVYDGSSNITLHAVCCQINAGSIKLVDHSEFKWLKASEINKLAWSAADKKLLNAVTSYLDPQFTLKTKL